MLEEIGGMLETFPEAFVAGAVVSGVLAYLGVFVILRRVVFIGVALSQVASAGIALAFVTGVNPFIGAFVTTLVAVTLLAYPYEGKRIPRDAVLGAVFVAGSALAVLIVSGSAFNLSKVKALLYGDIILTSKTDMLLLLLCHIPVVLLQILFLRPTTLTFLDRDNARIMGIRTAFWELLYFYCLGLAVASACKVMGSILVFAYLVLPSMTALLLLRRLVPVLVVCCIIAEGATFWGVYLSCKTDLPANQLISVLMLGVLMVAVVLRLLRRALALLAVRRICPQTE